MDSENGRKGAKRIKGRGTGRKSESHLVERGSGKELYEKLDKQEEEKRQESNTIEEKWEEIKRIMYGTMVKKRVRKKKKKLGHKDLWD